MSVRRFIPALGTLLCLCCLSVLPAQAVERLDIEDSIRALAFLQDRSTGTSGAENAAELIERAFSTAFSGGLPYHEKVQTGRQTFTVPIRTHEGSSITLLSEDLPMPHPIFPLQMNALATGTIKGDSLTGNLIYGGSGSLHEFSGLDVAGAVVLLDIASGKNWLNAAMLGAGAVIYIDGNGAHGTANRFLFQDKYEQTPLDFPRFWMSSEQADALFGPLHSINGFPPDTFRVQLQSRTTWYNTSADNVWVFIPGSDPALDDEYMLVQAFYDSTAFVPDNAPGADEAVSAATLLHMANDLAEHQPKRSVLLMATAGHAQSIAGCRALTWVLTRQAKEIQAQLDHFTERRDNARRTLTLLDQDDPFAAAASQRHLDSGDTERIRLALYSTVKSVMDEQTTELMRLRLIARPNKYGMRINELASHRLALRRLTWIATPHKILSPIDPSEQDLLRPLLQRTQEEQQSILEDAEQQITVFKSSLELLKAIDSKNMIAGYSLHLSSHGEGVGAFGQGWLYDLNESVNRTRFFAPLDDALTAGMARLNEKTPLWQATLRPDRSHPWQSYLPDKPNLASEPLALGGLPVVTIATLYDLRTDWGTPHDTPDRVDFAFVRRQADSIKAMLQLMAALPMQKSEVPKSAFSTLEGRANLQRQGELFPDKPAFGSVVLTYLGDTPFYSMVDTEGNFRVQGLANRKLTVHKAVIEALRFNPETGLAVWAVDKTLTGKDNYRVKINRHTAQTDLIMFGCTQTTLFNMLEARTLEYLYRPEIIDARTESQPLRYWYSRMDTRSSTLATLFLEPDVPFKLTLSDTVLGKKMLLLNTNASTPMGKGFPVSKWSTVPLTEFRAAQDMWALLTPRIQNLEEHGIINDRIRVLHHMGAAAMQTAISARQDKRWDTMFEASRSALAYASLVYNDVDKTQRDVLTGVLFYIALFVPFAYCMERLVFGFVSIHKRILGFCGVLLTTIAVIYAVHPAFQLTYSPGVVILAFFIMGLSILVALIIFFRFEREMEELQRRSRHIKSSEISKWSAFSASMTIGVSNLRRRPVRTVLTIITLVILTFTIMNFTAAKSIRKEGWVAFKNTAPYHGLLLKKLHWGNLPPETLQIVNDMLGATDSAAPRVWYETKDHTSAPVIPLRSGDKQAVARAIIGLSSHEGNISHLSQTLTAGEWFKDEDRMAVILPESIAAKLGIQLSAGAASKTPPLVTLWGQHFTVRGIIEDAGLETQPDLDGEFITPIFYPNESASKISEVEAEALAEGEDILQYDSRYVHVNGRDTIIIPAAALLAAGGSLKSVAFRLPGTDMGMSGMMHGNMQDAMPETMPKTRPKAMHEAMRDNMNSDSTAEYPAEDGTPHDLRITPIPRTDDSVSPHPDSVTEPSGHAMGSGMHMPAHMDMAHTVTDLGDRFGTMLFRGNTQGTALYFSSNATSYTGISNILIPLAISILIVLNTMIGSVHERKGEIGIYTSIGLAPSHVSFLFVAEALAFAVISVVFGYLVAQGAAALFAGTPLWEGMTANYSSTAGVAAMIIVIAVTLISVIYPSRVASQIAIPDVSRSWKLPDTMGDTITITLPFLIKTTEQTCAGGYLMEYYNAHADISHGEFSTEDLSCTFIPPGDLPGHGIDARPQAELASEDVCFIMNLKAWLAPFDFGVRQKAKLIFCPSEIYVGFKQITVILTREAGEQMVWRNLNKRFLDGLRKQLLIWRSLDDDARREYETELEHMISIQDQATVITEPPDPDGLHGSLPGANGKGDAA